MQTFTLNAQAAQNQCCKCGKPFEPNSMIHETRGGKNPVERDWCISCWSRQADKPAAPQPAAQKPWSPEDAFGLTTWKTYAEAAERHQKVALYLGVLPEISPRDPAAGGPFTVRPDSPLVPGFPKAAK